MSDTPCSIESPPPLLGEHTEEVLQKLAGYTQEDVKRLREKKII
jgi:crotonobetainyl-CoA:carnitine CoA-transferase CaiB-like acyl-CoA transferase